MSLLSITFLSNCSKYLDVLVWFCRIWCVTTKFHHSWEGNPAPSVLWVLPSDITLAVHSAVQNLHSVISTYFQKEIHSPNNTNTFPTTHTYRLPTIESQKSVLWVSSFWHNSCSISLPENNCQFKITVKIIPCFCLCFLLKIENLGAMWRSPLCHHNTYPGTHSVPLKRNT